MPLRVRLIALICLVLLVSLTCGSVLVAWRSANSVRIELRAALNVGANTVRNETEELAGADDRAGVSQRLIATFNGNRHVRATLLDPNDRPVAASELLIPAQPVPDWFRYLIGDEPGTLRFAIPPPGEGAIVLRTDPANEISEVWAGSRDAVLVLAGFAVLSVLLICTVVGRALRPLVTLSNAFDQIGKGNYHGRVPAYGPPELIRLANGLNVMTQRLATVAAQNLRLNERLLTLQAQERADLARDLHDEIGPLLFAVDMTAATIERLTGSGRGTEIPAQVRSIQDAVGRMQRHVQMLLGRLRPIQAIGLEVAIDRLTAFWNGRGYDTIFDVTVLVEEDRIDYDLKETIYRVVQEGVSNAIRHGNPTRVEIAIVNDDAGGIRVEVSDDGVGMAMDGAAERDPTQLGLIGMRERVMAMAGSLSIQHGRDGKGLAIVARLPLVDGLQPRELGKPE